MSIMLAAKILNLESFAEAVFVVFFRPPSSHDKTVAYSKKMPWLMPALKDVYTFLLNSTYNNDDNILYYQY